MDIIKAKKEGLTTWQLPLEQAEVVRKNEMKRRRRHDCFMLCKISKLLQNREIKKKQKMTLFKELEFIYYLHTECVCVCGVEGRKWKDEWEWWSVKCLSTLLNACLYVK
ncbi:hypothetical protein Hanom_Chr06g00549411 [Helianthus anomalus]